ncbi:MAG TPA: winged helix-turn-helix domain-containing protein [Steroidobacteraceae bacterium]|jgi:non-specific serine/threonine protein kinase|nr:winged helix-turn-helix domain-containing protein [Steroidobacteraceae bacterium]
MTARNSAIYRCGDCVVEAGNRRFLRGGEALTLEPRVFAVIVQLLAHAGDLVPRNALLDAVWGHRYVTDSTVSRVIILARRAFGDDTETSQYIQTVRGAGYRYVGPVERLLPAGQAAEPQFEPPPEHRVPAQLEELIGREADLRRLADLLTQFRGVTILGPGGIGKTQCAYEYARRNTHCHPDGVWLFDLVPTQSAQQWLVQLAAALGMDPGEYQQSRREVLRQLADRRLLLVLDNCERTAPELGELALDVLHACKQVRLLATSQRPLNYVGERLLRLAPLALPTRAQPRDESELAEARGTAALALLLRRIQAAEPGFELHLGNASALIEICARLDGMPLALEFAAPRFALLSPEQVLERLRQRFEFLANSAAGRDDRHRNLQAVLSWAYSLLAQSEQRLLAWLGVFVQGWTADSAIALAARAGYSPEAVIDLMNGLVDKSLIVVDLGCSPPRYRLLESVREFALLNLKRMQEEDLAREAHLAALEVVTNSAFGVMRSGQLQPCIDQMAEEHGNLEAAVDYAVGSARDREAGFRILGNLVLYLGQRTLVSPGLSWCMRVSQSCACVDDAQRARFLLSRGILETHAGKTHGDACTTLCEAQALALRAGDVWTEGFAAAYRALWLIIADQVPDAIELISRAAAIADTLCDPTLAHLATWAEGWVYFSRGSFEDCIRVMEPSRTSGYAGYQAIFFHGYVALAQHNLGRTALAAQAFLEGSRLAAAHRSIRAESAAVEGCAYLAHRRGMHDCAAQLLGAAQRMREVSETPLLRFWQHPHDETERGLRASMGGADYEAAVTMGKQMRFERAIKQASHMLEQLASATVASQAAKVSVGS